MGAFRFIPIRTVSTFRNSPDVKDNNENKIHCIVKYLLEILLKKYGYKYSK